MSALSKFKSLFGEKEKEKSSPREQKANHLKEVKREAKNEVKADGHKDANTKRDKAEVEILQKKIRDQIKRDPKLQKKAAMILENMLKGQKDK